jgi:predicted dehydrogenase
VLSAKVVGAGSIGNHLTHALRTLGVQVTIADVDSEALERTRNVIYPERYGAFDEAITLAHPNEIGDRSFDICVIGTPPDTHLALAAAELRRGNRAVLFEKPLGPRGQEGLSGFVRSQDEALGSLVSVSGRMREDWSGILKAHPWLADATESYLGHTERGGGALYEHSHATDFALFIAHALGAGRPETVAAELDVVEHDTGSYDREARLAITTSSGIPVDVVQDLFTWPAEKSLVATFTNGSLRWEMHSDHDLVRVSINGKDDETVSFSKTRPDDFLPEMTHVVGLLESNQTDVSPLDLSEALYTSWTLEAAMVSHETGHTAPVRHDAGDHA